MRNLILALRLIAAAILLQTLFFKFTGAEESVYIFSKLGAEPWGRWFSGVAELVTCILLLVPATQLLGAVAGLGIISGALLSHIFVLGVVVQNDGGLLFALAVVVFVCCGTLIILQRQQVLNQIKSFRTFLKV